MQRQLNPEQHRRLPCPSPFVSEQPFRTKALASPVSTAPPLVAILPVHAAPAGKWIATAYVLNATPASFPRTINAFSTASTAQLPLDRLPGLVLRVIKSTRVQRPVPTALQTFRRARPGTEPVFQRVLPVKSSSAVAANLVQLTPYQRKAIIHAKPAKIARGRTRDKLRVLTAYMVRVPVTLATALMATFSTPRAKFVQRARMGTSLISRIIVPRRATQDRNSSVEAARRARLTLSRPRATMPATLAKTRRRLTRATQCVFPVYTAQATGIPAIAMTVTLSTLPLKLARRVRMVINSINRIIVSRLAMRAKNSFLEAVKHARHISYQPRATILAMSATATKRRTLVTPNVSVACTVLAVPIPVPA